MSSSVADERTSFEDDVLGASRRVINKTTNDELLHDEYYKTLRKVEEMERKRRLPPMAAGGNNNINDMDEDMLLSNIKNSQEETARCKALLSQKLLGREYEARENLLKSEQTYSDAVTASAYLAAPLPHHPETCTSPNYYYSKEEDHYRHQVKTPPVPATSPREKRQTKYPVFW